MYRHHPAPRIRPSDAAHNSVSGVRGVSRRLDALAGDDSGVVAIEFALVLPLILTFLFAIIDFGQVFNNLNDANQIAAMGARYAAVNVQPSGQPLETYLAQQADTQGLKNNIQVCIRFPNTTANVGDPVSVEVTSSYKLVPLLGGSTIQLHGKATMRLERPPSFTASC